MHAFLLVGNNREEIDKRIAGFEGRKVTFTIAKIADVRELDNFTKFKVNEKTSIVVKDFDQATTESQNAFLKSLEEPQENLIFILTAANTQNILDTIVSRCEVIEIKYEPQTSKEETERFEKFVNSKVGEKLSIISKINKREEATQLMDNLIVSSHAKFLQNPDLNTFLEEASKAKRNLEANGNVQLQLTNFVVNLN